MTPEGLRHLNAGRRVWKEPNRHEEGTLLKYQEGTDEVLIEWDSSGRETVRVTTIASILHVSTEQPNDDGGWPAFAEDTVAYSEGKISTAEYAKRRGIAKETGHE